MDTQVVRYGLRTAMFWILGVVSALLALPFCFLVIWRFAYFDGFYFADGLTLAGLLMFAGLATWSLGLAIQKPTALRMDVHGISGFFAPTLSWTDIKWVPQTVGSGGKTIWLDLHDSKGFWARQSTWARIATVLNAQAGMVGVQVQTIRANPDDILDTLRQMHARFG